MTHIVDIMSEAIKFTPQQKLALDREFKMLSEANKSTGGTITGGRMTRVSSGTLTIGYSDGIVITNPANGNITIELEPDGDVRFGSNTRVPASTSLATFSNAQRYNSENMGAGDVLLGDNTTSRANLLWRQSTGVLYFRSGQTANAYISTTGSLVATGANITGTITATAGTIAGWTIATQTISKTGVILDALADAIYLGEIEPRIVLDGGNKVIKSSNYSAGLTGFNISGATGNAEFNDVRVRGTIAASVLAYGEVTATAGTLGVFKSAGKLRKDVTINPAGSDTDIEVTDPDIGHVQLFAVNDILLIKSTQGTNWLLVTSVTDNTTYYTYTCELSSGTAATFKAGTAIADYGPSGTGFITLSSDGTVGTTPNITLATHAGSPWSTITPVGVIGNMNGAYGYSSDTYGAAFGRFAASNTWLSLDSTNGLRIMSGTTPTQLAKWDTSGNITIGRAASGQSNIYISSGAISMRVNTTERIGLSSAGVLTIKDSAGDAVFTFNASAGAEFTKGLTMGTSGSVTAGNVVLNSNGISIDVNDNVLGTATKKLKFVDGANTRSQVYSYSINSGEATSLYLRSDSDELSRVLLVAVADDSGTERSVFLEARCDTSPGVIKAIHTDGGLCVGSFPIMSAYPSEGDLWTVNDAYITGGMIVGANVLTDTVTDSELWVNDNVRMTGGLYVGKTDTEPTAGTINAMLNDSATNAASSMLLLRHSTSGTAAAGFGTTLDFELESASGDVRSGGAIRCAWTTATDASRASKIDLITRDASAARVAFTVGSSGSAATIGAYGATPVAKPTVTGSRGSNAALASLLTALADIGFITDSTS